MKKSSRHQKSSGRPAIKHRACPAGFTLVEMLVSVAIVLLMMSMFAQIFQMATGSLAQQRGIAENDQRARLLTSTFRSDVENRTFRDLFPFRSAEDTRLLGRSLIRRAGYFEIDENNPLDDTDDVLQFTISMNVKQQNRDGVPYYGRAIPLSGRTITNMTATSIEVSGDYTLRAPASTKIWIIGSKSSSGKSNNGRYTVSSSSFSLGTTTINLPPSSLDPSITPYGFVSLSESEPEFDDGLFGNLSSFSPFAEVCYFLRNGVLYRRVLLIRDTGHGSTAQPAWSNGDLQLWNSTALNENYPTTGSTSGTTFWRDFDNSAFYFPGKTSGGTTYAPGVRFHGSAESLSNSSQAPLQLTDDTTTTSPLSFPVSLGIPALRFGHGTTGMPQDGSSAGVDGIWGNGDDLPITFRRFNLQECSSSAFGYPGYIPSAGNPMNRTDLTVNAAGLVTQYATGTDRRGEDILMTNVLSFDVKVWDPVSNLFVDVGDTVSAPNGPFSPTANGRLNAAYAPNGHYRFDTWHPGATVSGNGEPPIVPYGVGPDGKPGVAGTDDDGANGIDDLGELGASGSDDVPFALSGIQIKINYRDVSSGQVRQVTIVQSLVDQVKIAPVTAEAPEE